MKKAILFLFVSLIALAGFSQSTTPRFGITPNADNTGRALNYKYKAFVDAAGIDSVSITPNAWETLYNVTLTDTLSIKSPNVTLSYYGDNIVVMISAASGTPRLKFVGANWITAGPITLSTGLRASIRFKFDGTKWVETGRVVL